MIDTHCHLIDPQFKMDLDAVIQRARSAGVAKIVNAGYDLATSIQVLEQAKKYPMLMPALGIHPNDAAGESLADLKELEELLRHEKVYAIGETGLDFYRDSSSRDAQRELFMNQIDIARRFSLPLIIHTRNSIDDAIQSLKEIGYYRGVFHCYSGTVEQARKIADLGFYLGFGGVLTFSRQTREVFKYVAVDRIVLETDAPFLAPVLHRGRRNEPAYIRETLKVGATLHGLDEEKFEQLTDMNAHYLFA